MHIVRQLLHGSGFTFVCRHHKTNLVPGTPACPTSLEAEGLKIGIGGYGIQIVAQGKFLGKPPTPDEIMASFAGKIDAIIVTGSVSLLGPVSFGLSSGSTEDWSFVAGTCGLSFGLPSFALEKTRTQRR